MDSLVRPGTLTAAVAKHIGELIVTGEFPPGSRLPEVTVAARLSVARGTVREALHLLVDEGLVEIYPHRGAVVAPITLQKLHEVYALRRLLESYAARVAVETGLLDAAAMGEIERALSRLRDATEERDDLLAFGDADLAFHSTISGLSGNETLLEILGALSRQIRRYMFWGKAYDDSDVGVEYAQHVRLFEVLTTGDPTATETAVRDHIERAHTILVKRLAERGLVPAAPASTVDVGDGSD